MEGFPRQFTEEECAELEPQAREVAALVEQVKPLLAGHAPQVQGAALAELLAIWLDGHRVPGDPQAETDLQKTLLLQHLQAVVTFTFLAAAERGGHGANGG